MADAADSKSVARKGVWVRLPPPAPTSDFPLYLLCEIYSHQENCFRLD